MSILQNLPDNLSYLSPIGFKFQINDFPEVNYFCQAANIPGISIGAIDVATPLKNVKFSGDEISYEELNIRFVVDENMKNWLSIYEWIISLGFPSKEDQEKYRRLQNSNKLTQDATLTVLTSNMNAQINFIFKDCFPLNLSSINFDSGNTDVEYVTADVSFAYDVYEVRNLLDNDKSFEGAPVNRNA